VPTVGTMGYMAPEQARGEDGMSRADVFSFGVILYQCLPAGAFPWVNAVALLVCHADGRSDQCAMPGGNPASIEMVVRRRPAKRNRPIPVDP